MRGKRRRHHKKLYAAGYLQGQVDPTADVRRHVVLAVCNVVAAAGLLGLVSYGFLSGRDDGARMAQEMRVEPTRPIIEGPVPVALASLTPRLVERPTIVPVRPVPQITNSAMLPSRPSSPPEDAIQLRGMVAAVDETGFGGAPTGRVHAASELRRVVIEGEAQEPIRLASLGSFTDILPDSRSARGDAPADAVYPSVGSLFREGPPDPDQPLYDTIPSPAPVPLTRRGDTGDVLVLSFAAPPFAVRDVEAEGRDDLIEAEAAARQAIEERGQTKERRLARERYCLAAAIYYEARGEPRDGQLAVAQVVLNRVDDPRYPSTICGVVFQDENRRHRCQFSFACDGRPERPRPGKSWDSALEIAKEFQGGFIYGDVSNATHYHADYVKPRWSRARTMSRIRQIGAHIFYFES